MKYIKTNNNIMPAMFYYRNQKRRKKTMLKFLAKVAEKYARSTNTTCVMMSILHQPKMPASLIKKD